MLRASKLYQSVSTSGPSAIWKPMPTNTSSRRSHAWVTMCARPRRGLPRNSVRSRRSSSTSAARALPASSPRLAVAASTTAAVASFSSRPASRRSSRLASDPSWVFSRPSEPPAAEHLGVDDVQRIERRGRGNVGERSVPSSTDVVDQGRGRYSAQPGIASPFLPCERAPASERPDAAQAAGGVAGERSEGFTPGPALPRSRAR